MNWLVILVGEQLLVTSGQEDMQPLPGSLEAIARLNHAGYQVALLHTCGDDSEHTSALLAELRGHLARVGGHLAGWFEQPDVLVTDEILRDVAARFSINLHHAVVVAGSVPGEVSLQLGNVDEPENPDFENCDDLQHAVEQLLSRH